MSIPDLILRWFHIMGAAAMIGGTVFILVALLPSLLQVDEAIRAKLHAELRSRWSKVVMAAIAVLLITGLANFFLANGRHQFRGTPYHMLFGVKFMIAMAIFFIASVISGRSALAEKFRRNAATWLAVNLILVMIVVGISGVLKVTREKAPAKEPEKVAISATDDKANGRD